MCEGKHEEREGRRRRSAVPYRVWIALWRIPPLRGCRRCKAQGRISQAKGQRNTVPRRGGWLFDGKNGP